MKYKIIADASVDIPESFIKKYDITILPIEVRFNDELYPNGLETNEFYKKLKETGIIPKTSKPNEYCMEEAFKPYQNKEDYQVITIVISSELAGTYESAIHVTETMGMKNNYIFDSKCTTIVQGALIMELCKYIEEQERTFDEVKNKLEDLRNKVRLLAIIDDLKYLKTSGRLSVTSYLAGSLLNIHPIITIEDGKVKNIAKKPGAKAMQYLAENIKKRDKSMQMYFGYTDALHELENFVNKFHEELEINKDETELLHMGCVIGSHVGPNCFAIVYFVD